jgi:hypothetical protein
LKVELGQISTPQADALIDGHVDFQDFVMLASLRMKAKCGYPDKRCEGADID